MRGAGPLDKRIRIERAHTGRDAVGGVTDEGWAPLAGPIWANRADTSDAERFKAEEQAAVRMTRFTVRSSTVTRLVRAQDRIFHDGDFYEITGIKQTADGRNRFLEFSTVVRNDATSRDL